MCREFRRVLFRSIAIIHHGVLFKDNVTFTLISSQKRLYTSCPVNYLSSYYTLTDDTSKLCPTLQSVSIYNKEKYDNKYEGAFHGFQNSYINSTYTNFAYLSDSKYYIKSNSVKSASTTSSHTCLFASEYQSLTYFQNIYAEFTYDLHAPTKVAFGLASLMYI